MTLPSSAGDVRSDHVVFELESIDRMYLNLYNAPHVRPGLGTNACSPLCRKTPRLVVGDHFEGQLEGQTAAREGLPEPVAACVSLCLA
jgi:hypothetical protein